MFVFEVEIWIVCGVEVEECVVLVMYVDYVFGCYCYYG